MLHSEHTSICGELLDTELCAFESKMEINLQQYLQNGDKTVLTPVFTTPSQRSIFHSIERKTKVRYFNARLRKD